MEREMTKQWRKLRNCRTCRFAGVTDRERSYTPSWSVRCNYPTNELPWPALPHSLTGAYGVVDNLERIKSGRLKKGISLRDPREGEGCQMWEEWQVAP
jgi:hypothetical protein